MRLCVQPLPISRREIFGGKSDSRVLKDFTRGVGNVLQTFGYGASFHLTTRAYCIWAVHFPHRRLALIFPDFSVARASTSVVSSVLLSNLRCGNYLCKAQRFSCTCTYRPTSRRRWCLQWAAIACVGVLIDDSALKLFLFCGFHVVMFVVLVWLKPFANR